jgi:alkyldihydroxyacetonephosphate synthase
MAAKKSRKSAALTKARMQEIQRIIGLNNMSSTPIDLRNYSRALEEKGQIAMRSGKTGVPPDLVAWPASTGQVSRLLRLANEQKISIIPYGGGSNLTGGTLVENGGIMLDLKRLDSIVSLDDKSLLVTVQAGMIGETLERELNFSGFTLGHFPSSIYCSTVGGWLATRSAGQLSTLYGKIEDMVVALEAVLADGTIVQLRPRPRAATGPDFAQLIIGSEGTLAVVTEATLRISMLPEKRIFASYLFRDLADGLDTIRLIMREGVRPAAVRLYDETESGILLRELDLEVSGNLLILTFEGLEEIADVEAGIAAAIAKKAKAKKMGEKPASYWWKHRYDVSYQQSRIMPNAGMVLDTVEVATIWSNLQNLYEKITEALKKEAIVTAHFSHAYPEGCSICFTAIARTDENKAAAKLDRIWKKALDVTVKAGGSISHHHGIGKLKAPWLKSELGNINGLLKKIKKGLDPNNILNPGKLGL